MSINQIQYAVVTLAWASGLAVGLAIYGFARERAMEVGQSTLAVLGELPYRLGLGLAYLFFLGGFVFTGAPTGLKLVVGVGLLWYLVETLVYVKNINRDP